jgi:hypothetical protein
MLVSVDHLLSPQDMDLDTGHAAAPHQLTSGRPYMSPHHHPSAREARGPGRTGPIYLAAFCPVHSRSHARPGDRGSSSSLSSCPENGAGRDRAGLEISPERNDQLSRDGDNCDLPHSTVQSADPLAIPSRQRTFGLVPQPSQLDRRSSRSRITGFADTLIAPAVATVERGRCKPNVAADLAAVCERSVETSRVSTVAKIGPTPRSLRSSSILTPASLSLPARTCSRSLSTVRIISITSCSRCHSRMSSAARRGGIGRPSPVCSPFRSCGQSARSGLVSLMPCVAKSPLLRLTCAVFAAISRSRSRC